MRRFNRHLVRPPVPVDTEMPYVKEGALEHAAVARAFPDRYEQLLAQIFIGAAHDNENEECLWAGVNAAYVEWLASAWWAVTVRRSWFWFLKLFWFPRSLAIAHTSMAMGALMRRGLVEELIEWDLVPAGGTGLESNQKMPVYYPTPAFIHRLNEGVS